MSPELVTFDRKPGVSDYVKMAYIQFRDKTPYQLDLSYNQRYARLILTLDGSDVPKDEKMLTYVNSLFYFTKK